jgi:hypothetical protein
MTRAALGLFGMKVELLYTEVWVCGGCGRWAYRCLKIESGSYGPDWSCEKCGCTSVRLRGPGRPIGPKCLAFRREVENFSAFVVVSGLGRRDMFQYARMAEGVE